MWKHGSCKEIDTQYYWITDSITELLTVLLSNTEVVAKILKLSMVVLFLRRILLELSRNHWSCAKARKHWLKHWVILTEYCVSISLHEPCFHIQDTNKFYSASRAKPNQSKSIPFQFISCAFHHHHHQRQKRISIMMKTSLPKAFGGAGGKKNEVEGNYNIISYRIRVKL